MNLRWRRLEGRNPEVCRRKEARRKEEDTERGKSCSSGKEEGLKPAQGQITELETIIKKMIRQEELGAGSGERESLRIK